MEKLVIAFVGPPLAGKGRFKDAIIEWCGPDKVSCHSTGDILRSVLEILGEPQARPDCNKLVALLKTPKPQGYGENFLAHAMYHRIVDDPRPVIIFDSMRLLPDEIMVQSLPYRTIRVYITAPPEVRYQRLMLRRRHGEEEMSFAQFCQHETLDTELLIREIGSRADVKLDNSGSDHENDATRLHFCRNYLHQEYAVD